MVTCTVQVTNVSPHASERQMKELFSYFGGIDEIRVYPGDDSLYSMPSKVCFVTFKERSSLETALHLTNTVFIDRALIVAQSRYEVIPDEDTALSLAAPAVASIGGSSGGGNALIPSAAPLLPTPGTPSQQPSLLGAPTNALLQTPLSNALQQVQAAASSIAAAVQAPVLTVAGSVIPQTAQITGNVDPTKIDEIRRTVYVGNLNTHLTADQVMHFFQPCGEIRYVRMAGDETQPTRFAFVEFTNPESVPIALQYNGALFGDRPVKVNHSKNAIVKPQGKTPELAQKEVDEAMQKVREATVAISTAIEPPAVSKRRSKFRSRTPSPNSSHRSRRSPGRRRSRSRSPRGRRRSSRSPRRRKSRSRSPRRKNSYSKSPGRYRKRSTSRSPRRRESRDYRGGYSRYSGSSSYHRHRSRSPDKDRNRRRRRSYSRSRSRSPKRSSSSRKSHKSYDDRDYRRRDRDRSPSPSEHKKSHKKKSKKEKRHKRSRSPTPRDSLSPEQSDVDSGHEEEEAGSRQSSDAEMVQDKDTSRSESDKATSEDDD